VRTVLLPATVSVEQFRKVQTRLKNDQRQVFSEAGVRFRTVSDRVEVRSERRDLVYAAPLQANSGGIRADARRRIADNTFGPGSAQVLEHITSSPFNIDAFAPLATLGVRMLTDDDPVDVMRGHLVDNPGSRFVRLGGTRSFMMRALVWDIIRGLARGEAAESIPLGTQRPDDMVLTGLLPSNPGWFICAPMTGRFQPLAAVLMTGSGADIALVPDGAYIRSEDFNRHPVGLGRPDLRGSGVGIYRTGVKAIPRGHGVQVLQDLTRGANELLNHLTDPTLFADGDGELDVDEQLITWANVRFGLSAVATSAELWGSPESIWTVFRALGTLQGVWEGSAAGQVGLKRLLDPSTIRAHALPAIVNTIDRTIYAGIIDNYESAILAAFPGRGMPDCLTMLAEVRNLVHGAGGPAKSRKRRLEALTPVAHNSPDLQLLSDVSTLWWRAVMESPRTLCIPGTPPGP